MAVGNAGAEQAQRRSYAVSARARRARVCVWTRALRAVKAHMCQDTSAARSLGCGDLTLALGLRRAAHRCPSVRLNRVTPLRFTRFKR
eukprot:6193170-Pleurochrysis_carterae.AAC.1